MNELKPLRELEDWMVEKVEKGLGTWARDGNGCYFLDFETLKYYSPWDDELLDEYCREFECINGELTCVVDPGCTLDKWWIDGYVNYLAEKELL